jgi:hypothetical protein
LERDVLLAYDSTTSEDDCPLPESSGPKSEITPQEKLAAKKLIFAMGHGQSRNNIFKWTAYLKLLSDLRDKGATTSVLGRTTN